MLVVFYVEEEVGESREKKNLWREAVERKKLLSCMNFLPSTSPIKAGVTSAV